MTVHRSSSEARSVHADFVERTYQALRYVEWCEKLGTHQVRARTDEIVTVETSANGESIPVAVAPDRLYVGAHARWVAPNESPPRPGEVPPMRLGNLSFGAAADHLAAAIDRAIVERVMGLYRVGWKQGPLPHLEAVTWGGLYTWSSIDNDVPSVLASVMFGALVVG